MSHASVSVIFLQLGYLDEDCVTELSVFHKQSRKSILELISEVRSIHQYFAVINTIIVNKLTVLSD